LTLKKKGSGKNDEIVVNSLLAEANMMKRLDHPSLPRIVVKQINRAKSPEMLLR